MITATWTAKIKDSILGPRSGQRVEVVRSLTQEEADEDEVGPMWKIRFDDRMMTDAFSDELTEWSGLDESLDNVIRDVMLAKAAIADEREGDLLNAIDLLLGRISGIHSIVGRW